MVTAKQAKAISERYAKAVELVEQGKVYPLHRRPNEYVVLNGRGEAYWVQLAGAETHCDCEDFRYRAAKLGVPCKHVIAAELYAERQQAGESPAPQPEPEEAPEDDDLPAAWCQGCGAAIEAGRLCAACEASARALLAHLQ
jgi:predicted nucleic acid-binding Zn finger protein